MLPATVHAIPPTSMLNGSLFTTPYIWQKLGEVAQNESSSQQVLAGEHIHRDDSPPTTCAAETISSKEVNVANPQSHGKLSGRPTYRLYLRSQPPLS
jgi:hypothetical protein